MRDTTPEQGDPDMTPREMQELLGDELVDRRLEGYENPSNLVGETWILEQLTAQLVERMGLRRWVSG